MNAHVKPADCPLTVKQLSIISQMADGKPAKVIAAAENITYHTVNSYIKTACDDTGAHRAIGLVAMALRKGWIS